MLWQRFIEVLHNIPYNAMVKIEQELSNSNTLTEEEILNFCDLHTAVLDDSIDLGGAKPISAGHLVDKHHKRKEYLLLPH